MKKIIVFTLAVLIVISVAGCGKSHKNKILGAWSPEYNDSFIYEFSDDGMVHISEDGGEHFFLARYSFDGKTLEFTVTSFSGTESFTWEDVSIDGDKMEVYDPSSQSTGRLIKIK